MFFAIGPALSALSSVSSLLETAASGVGQAAGNELSALSQYFTSNSDQSQSQPTSGGSSSPLDSGTMAALLSLQGQSSAATGGACGLFAKLDADGDGSISKSEFESALGNAGVDTNSADALFSKLDANGDGSITKSELASARHAYQGTHHHRHAGGAGQGGGVSSLLNATNADGSTTQTTANSDGSSTTTITYADGSTVTLTTLAASQNSGTSGGGSGSSGSGNLLEKLIQMQSMFISQSAPTTTAVA
jgi:hypothetical protein